MHASARVSRPPGAHLAPRAGDIGVGGDAGTLRYLLGSQDGTLFALALCRDTTQSIFPGTSIPTTTGGNGSSSAATHPITAITLDYVGRASVASTLTYLSGGLLFVRVALGYPFKTPGLEELKLHEQLLLWFDCVLQLPLLVRVHLLRHCSFLFPELSAHFLS